MNVITKNATLQIFDTLDDCCTLKHLRMCAGTITVYSQESL